MDSVNESLQMFFNFIDLKGRKCEHDRIYKGT